MEKILLKIEKLFHKDGPKKLFLLMKSYFGRITLRFLILLKKAVEKPLMHIIDLLFIKCQDTTQQAGDKSKKPHFLILRYRYYCAEHDMGESTEKFSLDNCLSAAETATYDVCCWEDFSSFPLGDLRLLKLCQKINPDAIIISSYNSQSLSQPSIETFRILRNRCNIPLIAIWWDTCNKNFLNSIRPVLPYIDIHIVSENPLLNFLDDSKESDDFMGKALALWTTFDPSLYNDPGFNRDIDVSFIGQVDSYRSSRLEYIQYLIDNNIPIYCSLSNRTQQLSHDEYRDILKRSKIVLNFSYSIDSHQLKGRVFEAMMCGALLLESENPQTSCLFIPGEDYVSFNSKEDLLEKIQYYLEHEAKRLEIASRGAEKVNQYYNHKEYWKKVVNKFKEL